VTGRNQGITCAALHRVRRDDKLLCCKTRQPQRVAYSDEQTPQMQAAAFCKVDMVDPAFLWTQSHPMWCTPCAARAFQPMVGRSCTLAQAGWCSMCPSTCRSCTAVGKLGAWMEEHASMLQMSGPPSAQAQALH